MKAVKVRFREGKASAEVLDFNVFLSPQGHVDCRGRARTGSYSALPTMAHRSETRTAACTIPNFTVGTAVPFRTGAYTGEHAVRTIRRIV